MLTKNEKLLVADALNGCNIMIDCDPNYLATMIGDSGARKNAGVIGRDDQGRVLLTGSPCCGLELEVYDAIRLNQLDEKWEVDASNIIHEIREMRPDLREKLVRLIGEVWARNDDNFERDLETLEL